VNGIKNCEHCRGLGFVCLDGSPANALGQPAPGRTDFTQWARPNLEAFARHAADENLLLRTSLKALQEAWRQEVSRDVPPGVGVTRHQTFCSAPTDGGNG
jgi:hypothetical protein